MASGFTFFSGLAINCVSPFTALIWKRSNGQTFDRLSELLHLYSSSAFTVLDCVCSQNINKVTLGPRGFSLVVSGFSQSFSVLVLLTCRRLLSGRQTSCFLVEDVFTQACADTIKVMTLLCEKPLRHSRYSISKLHFCGNLILEFPSEANRVWWSNQIVPVSTDDIKLLSNFTKSPSFYERWPALKTDSWQALRCLA